MIQGSTVPANLVPVSSRLVSGASPKREQGPLLRTQYSPTSAGNDRGSQDSHTSAWPCASPRLAVRGKRSRGCTRRTWTTNPGKFMRSYALAGSCQLTGEPRSVSFRVSPCSQEHDGACPSRPCSSGGPTLRFRRRVRRRRVEDLDHGLGHRPRTADTSHASGGHMFPCPTDQLPMS